MPKHVIIWSEGKDNIEVFTEEPTVVVKASRGDLTALATLEEAKLPGVYFLIHENKRYVGQASGGVVSRLQAHGKSKDWWSEIIFFAREDGRLDKSQLDFLEAKCIHLFKNAGMDMDNGTNGNVSHIEPYQKGRASQALSTALRLLKDTAHVDVFKKVRGTKKTLLLPAVSNQPLPVTVSSVTNSKETFTITDDNGALVEGQSAREAYVKYLTVLVEDNEIFSKFLKESETSKATFLESKANIPKEKERFYRLLRDDLYIYCNASRESLAIALSKDINRITGYKAVVSWVKAQ